MSKRSQNGSTSGTIVYFGEDLNDCNAIKILVSGLLSRPRMYEHRILKKPLTLVKGLDAAKRKSRAARVEVAIRALNVRKPVRATIFHEDADEVEPAHEQRSKEIRETYNGFPGIVVAAVPAWELETWWFLFPKAVGALHASWRDPDQYVGRDVGKVQDAKQKLANCVRPAGTRKGPRFPEYKESDCPKIAANVVDFKLIKSPAAKSASWDHFIEQVSTIR